MKELLTGLIGPVSGLLDTVISDKDAAAKLAHEIATMADRHAQEAMLAQIAVNKAEAQGNWFQASLRPLYGYVCVLWLATNFFIQPILPMLTSNVVHAARFRCRPFQKILLAF